MNVIAGQISAKGWADVRCVGVRLSLSLFSSFLFNPYQFYHYHNFFWIGTLFIFYLKTDHANKKELVVTNQVCGADQIVQ